MTEPATYAMLDTQPSIQSFPASQPEQLVCPVCGSTDVAGTVEHVTGLAGMYELTYTGETDIDWDSQRTVYSINGDPLVQCGDAHWYFAVGAYFREDDGALSVAPIASEPTATQPSQP